MLCVMSVDEKGKTRSKIGKAGSLSVHRRGSLAVWALGFLVAWLVSGLTNQIPHFSSGTITGQVQQSGRPTIDVAPPLWLIDDGFNIRRNFRFRLAIYNLSASHGLVITIFVLAHLVDQTSIEHGESFNIRSSPSAWGPPPTRTSSAARWWPNAAYATSWKARASTTTRAVLYYSRATARFDRQ